MLADRHYTGPNSHTPHEHALKSILRNSGRVPRRRSLCSDPTDESSALQTSIGKSIPQSIPIFRCNRM